MAAHGTIRVRVVTLERVMFESESDWATVPAADGDATILPNHTPYIAGLRAGTITIARGEAKDEIAITGGFAEFGKNTLTVLATTAGETADRAA